MGINTFKEPVALNLFWLCQPTAPG